jgi:2-polyprenyl-3-methyl-5-hydroxy-6-metoxy-1,4-benzoquinol methylase
MVELVRHELGFWELSPKPTPEELKRLYTTHYFDSQNFEVRYDDEERFQKYHPYREAEFVSNRTKGRVLDIGCGEGFSLDWFHSRGWDAFGLDFSRDGIKRHFPNLAERVTPGDLFRSMELLMEQGQQFDLVITNNVLEHVLDPIAFLKQTQSLLAPGGLCRMQVPNDDSPLHRVLNEKKLAPERFWIVAHEHMSYFNAESLSATMRHCGFQAIELLGDFPIDLFLLNPDSNYVFDRTKGKHCHRTRIAFENMLVRQGVDQLVAFRRGCGQSGVGRNIIAYGRKGD